MAILRIKDQEGNQINVPAIRGPEGPEGPEGPQGETGATGAAGANATINGVNALTLIAGDGLDGVQSGSTYTISLRSHTHTGTATATVTTNWINTADGYYYQDIAIDGMFSDDNPIVDVLPGEDNAANVIYSECICKVFRITAYDDMVRVWATEEISTAFPIQLKVVR